MRALRLEGNRVVTVVDVPEPNPSSGEVVVETVASALCGSEFSAYRREEGSAGNSGHEAAGILVQLGAGVTDLKIGQRVGLSAVVGCGQCADCQAGRYTWCGEYRVYSNMHAERIVIPARGCHPLPDDVDWDVGVLITGDGLGVPYHTSTKMRPDVETVAIFGVGPVGLGNTLMQSFLGREVIAVDVTPMRLEMARNLGAAHAINALEQDPLAQVLELTSGRGVDVCIEAAGRPETLKQCFAAVRSGGQVLMNGEQGSVELSPSNHFIRRDITATGSWFYHFSEYSEMLALYRNGLRVADLVTHRFRLSDSAAAFQAFDAGHTGKVLIEMKG